MTYPPILARLLAQSGLAAMLPWVLRLTEGGAGALPYYSDDLLGAACPELAEVLPLQQPAPAAVLDLATAGPRCPLPPAELPDCYEPAPVGGLPALKLTAADHLRKSSGLTVQPSSEVLITSGVAGALVLALGALVNRGDRIVLFDPASPLYRLAARHRLARVRWVRTWVEDGVTRFDPLQLIDAMRGARLVVVNSPANPTGGVFAPEALEQIAWWADRRDVLIFNDEALQAFRTGPAASIAVQPRAVDRTLTAGSVSKGCGLPALRVGWLAGHRQLIRPCLLHAATQWQSVPTMCQEAALAALKQDADAYAPMHDLLNARRQMVQERLQALHLNVTPATTGCHLWVNVGKLGLTGEHFADLLLHSQKVLVWPGHHFGPASRDCVRLSCAGDEVSLRKGLARLGACVRQLRATGSAAVSKWAA